MNILVNPGSLAVSKLSDDYADFLLKQLSGIKETNGALLLPIPGGLTNNPCSLKELFNAMGVMNPLIFPRAINKTVIKPVGGNYIPAGLDIIPVFSCNLHCKYCWNTYGTYGHKFEIMREKTAVQTGRWVSGLIEKSAKQKRGITNINFFGGEPLLNCRAFKIITEDIRIVAKRCRYKLNIQLSTNALLLSDEIIRFCRDYQVDLAISLDGPKEAHDAMRQDVSGKGSHIKVIDAIKRIQKVYPEGLSISASIGKPYDYMKTCDYLHGLGVTNFQIETLMPDAVSCHGVKRVLDAEHYDLNECFSQKRKFIKEYLNRLASGDNLYPVESVFNSIEQAMSMDARITCCGLGAGPAVLPDGKLSPCIAFVFDRSKVLGDVWKGFYADAINVLRNQAFLSCHVLTNKQCKNCFARYWCGGTCYARNLAVKGDIRRLDEDQCAGNRAHWLCNFYALALLEEKVPGLFKKMIKNRDKGRGYLFKIFQEYCDKKTKELD